MLKEDLRIQIELERSRIKREKARLILDKSISLYFLFMIIAVLGFLFGYIDSFMLNTLIILGFVILIAGSFPYIRTVHKEEKKLDGYLKK